MEKSPGRPQNYTEGKKHLNMTLTPTAIEWLIKMQILLEAKSKSDVIELLARQQPKD